MFMHILVVPSQYIGPIPTRKLCYRKDDREMRAI